MINKFDVMEIVKTIKNVLPETSDYISLHEPSFEGNEWEYVKDCLDSGWVSSVGKYVDRFENQLADFTGVKYAIAVSNGTAALHIALKIAGVKQNDEVLIPDLTFVATANAVTYLGAIPHLVDIEYKTLGLDPHKLEDYLKEIAEVRKEGCYNKRTGNRIKAVVPMHTFGHPVDLDPLLELGERFKIDVIEDAAESLGSYYKGKHTGGFGKVATLSFNGNKVVTTGGGGAILTDDKELAKIAKYITTTAKRRHQWEFYHDQIGYNYRLPNINAALGCAQLEELPQFLVKKRNLAEKYKEAFSHIDGLSFFSESEFSRSNYWLNALILDIENRNYRNELLEITNNEGIMTRPVWTLMHKLPMYKDNPRMNNVIAEDIEQRLINIPSSQSLGG